MPAPQKTTIVTCQYCSFTDAFVPSARNEYECQRCHEVTHTIADTDKVAAFRGAAPSDHIGMTALHCAVRDKGHVDVVRALVTHGALLPCSPEPEPDESWLHHSHRSWFQ